MKKQYIIALSVLTFVSLVSCISDTTRKLGLEVSFTGNDAHTELHYAKVISGGDTIRWYGIEHGKTYHATLYPGAVNHTNLTLFYKLTENDTETIWESNDRDADSEWAVKLTISSEKTVYEQACVMPCRLE